MSSEETMERGPAREAVAAGQQAASHGGGVESGTRMKKQAEPAKEADKKDKATEEVQTVTVTGIRRGIEAAIAIKKNSDSIVEAISVLSPRLSPALLRAAIKRAT